MEVITIGLPMVITYQFSGKFENVKWFLGKIWKHVSGVPKSRWREKERKKPDSRPSFKGVRKEQDKEVFGEMASWPGVDRASQLGNDLQVVHWKQTNFGGTECVERNQVYRWLH